MNKTKNRNKMVKENIELAYYIANRFTNKRVDRDDLKQIASIGLIKAAESYDPSRGVNFGQYAGRVIRNELINATSKADKFPLPMEQEDVNKLEEESISPAEKELFLHEIEGQLESREFIALQLEAICDCTQEQIAGQIGVSQAQVCRILKKAKVKAKKFLLEGGR